MAAWFIPDTVMPCKSGAGAVSLYPTSRLDSKLPGTLPRVALSLVSGPHRTSLPRPLHASLVSAVDFLLSVDFIPSLALLPLMIWSQLHASSTLSKLSGRKLTMEA